MMQYKLRQFQGCHNGNCTNSKRSKPFHVVFHKKSFVIESTLRIFTRKKMSFSQGRQFQAPMQSFKEAIYFSKE